MYRYIYCFSHGSDLRSFFQEERELEKLPPGVAKLQVPVKTAAAKKQKEETFD